MHLLVSMPCLLDEQAAHVHVTATTTVQMLVIVMESFVTMVECVSIEPIATFVDVYMNLLEIDVKDLLVIIL